MSAAQRQPVRPLAGLCRLLAGLSLAASTSLAASAAEPVPVPAPFAFSAPGLDDKRFDFATLRGKPLVVNFWARWCAPCRKEIPDLVEMDAKYRGRGVAIVGVAIEETQMRDKVRDFVRGYGVDYRIVLAGTSRGVELMSALGNSKSALPFTVVIDRSGKVVASKLGAMSRAEMEAAIETALR